MVALVEAGVDFALGINRHRTISTGWNTIFDTTVGDRADNNVFIDRNRATQCQLGDINLKQSAVATIRTRMGNAVECLCAGIETQVCQTTGRRGRFGQRKCGDHGRATRLDRTQIVANGEVQVAAEGPKVTLVIKVANVVGVGRFSNQVGCAACIQSDEIAIADFITERICTARFDMTKNHVVIGAVPHRVDCDAVFILGLCVGIGFRVKHVQLPVKHLVHIALPG